MSTLKSYAAKELLTLTDALSACKQQLKSAIALLYSSDWCGFAVMDDDGNLLGPEGQKVPTFEAVYEARVFNNDAELRWLHKEQGRGRAVLLAENEISNSFQKIGGIEYVKALEQTYLLWGEGVNVSPGAGWSRLTTARIGRLDVPVGNVPVNGRVLLIVREYVDAEKFHGNVSVNEERLLRLEVA